MKNLILLLLVLTIAGCASHAQINMPAVTKVFNKGFENKSLFSEILYSQPEPGVFSGGNQMPLAPLKDAKLSVASAATLQNLPDYIYKQLPSSTRRAIDLPSDFKLRVELIAHDKKGPAYADYEFLKSFGKNLFTLGFASSEYDIIADFDVKYVLFRGEQKVFSKEYKVAESVDHERGDFESHNSVNDYSAQLLEKHLILTLNDFFQQASAKI